MGEKQTKEQHKAMGRERVLTLGEVVKRAAKLPKPLFVSFDEGGYFERLIVISMYKNGGYQRAVHVITEGYGNRIQPAYRLVNVRCEDWSWYA